MPKSDRIAAFEVWFDISVVDLALDLVWDEDHHHIGPLGRFWDFKHIKTFGLRFFPAFASWVETYFYIHTAISQVFGVGMSLASKTDDRHFFIFNQIDITIFVVIDWQCHFPSFAKFWLILLKIPLVLHKKVCYNGVKNQIIYMNGLKFYDIIISVFANIVFLRKIDEHERVYFTPLTRD